jgi:nucleoside-diphosphate-sugar epimerase
LVIGTGSVGLILMEALVARGEKKVKGLDVVAPRRAVAGATFVLGNVTDLASLKAACEGVDVVYFTVALIRYYERLAFQYTASHAVNVTGTQNVLSACAECGVQVLVQTSTSNVCVSAGQVNGEMDETSPLVGAHNSPNHYGWTKAQAEAMVLGANGSPLTPAARGALQTVAVRPCSGIFGLHDNFITERWLDLGSVQIMLPEPTIDYVYNENVVYGAASKRSNRKTTRHG